MKDSITQLITRTLELDEAATPGPWTCCRVDACHNDCNVYDDQDGLIVQGVHGDNATTIAEYRTAAPVLAKECQRLQKELNKTNLHLEEVEEELTLRCIELDGPEAHR